MAQVIHPCGFYISLFQLVDITGKDQDESMIALHDCNGDVNRAINVLLEGSPDTVSSFFQLLKIIVYENDLNSLTITILF